MIIFHLVVLVLCGAYYRYIDILFIENGQCLCITKTIFYFDFFFTKSFLVVPLIQSNFFFSQRVLI